MNDKSDEPEPMPDDDEALGAMIRGHATHYRASAGLHSGVRAEIALQTAARPKQAGVPRAGRPAWPWLAATFAGGALAASVLLPWTGAPLFRGPDESLAGELVGDHLRSLQVGHLSDVVSTDQHTVKPWFQGKLAYAPPVEDFAGDGFPLAGGRLDYVAGQPVAALVYHRRGHVINVFVWPASGDVGAGTPTTQRGFHVVRWHGAGMQLWAVSDVSQDELVTFERLWRERTPTKP